MSPEMFDMPDRRVTRALDDYSENLRAERLSAALDARMEDSIVSWAEEHRSQSVLRRPALWLVTAASLAVIAGGIALLAAGQRDDGLYDSPGHDRLIASTPEFAPLPAGTAVSPYATGGQVSLFPAEGAVFRVRANLDSAAVRTSGQAADGERQYWVDVRIANDGTMRIMQVLPAERSRVVPLE